MACKHALAFASQLAENEKEREKISEEVFIHQNWKRQILLLLTFHWPELVAWPHEAAEESGNCHQL